MQIPPLLYSLPSPGNAGLRTRHPGTRGSAPALFPLPLFPLSFLLLLALCIPCGKIHAAPSVTTTYPTNINSTSAWLTATIAGTGIVNVVTGRVYYGTTDGGTSATAWAATSAAQVVTGLVSYTIQADALTQNTRYYFRPYIADTTGTNAWGSETWSFRTRTSPSNVPAPYYITVMVDTNGVIVYPTNFIAANSIVIDALVAATIVPGDTYLAVGTNGSTNTITFPGATGFPTRVEFEAGTNAAHAESTNIQAQITAYLPIYQYYARTNAGETVEVRSSTTNVTCARTNAVFYPDVPAGHFIDSLTIRVTGDLTDSGKIYIALGTNSFTPAGNAYRESDSAYVAIVPRRDPADATRTLISGLGTSASETYQLHLVY